MNVAVERNGNSHASPDTELDLDFPVSESELEPETVGSESVLETEEEESLGGFGLTAAESLDDDEEQFSPSSGLDLAALSGYNPAQEAQPAIGLDASESQTAVLHSDTDEDYDSDDLDEAVVDPRSVKTKHGLIGSPYTKFAVVGAGTLMVALAIGAFLTSVTGNKNQQPIVAVPTPTSPVEATPDGSDEVAKYKTETALARQKELLNGASKPQPLPSASPTAKPTPLPVSPPVSMPQTMAPIPVMPATALLTAPLTAPTAIVPTDPLEKWRMAATMGSYGNIPNTPGGSSSAPAAFVNPAPVAYTPPPVTPSVNSGSNGALSLTQLRSSSSTPGLRDQPLSAVLVGSSVPAQLATAIVMAGDNSTPVAPDSPSATRYLVRLTGDLKDAAGNVALPSGSQVVVVARTFSQQGGSAEFVATSVIVNNKEYSAPKDALVVRSTNGGLLSFKKENGGGGLFKSILPAFFAGASQAGQSLNQPTSSASVSGGSVSATTTSSNPNPAAGFLQGFGQNLSQQLQQQTQAANQAAASKPAAWSLGAGTAVTVFVNSSFQL
ncbi:MAG: hypothetical protein RBJ76_01005 [Stenomitos frigidus ULC029]